MKKSLSDPYVLKMVSVAEAARIIGISRSYMYQLVNQEEVKSYKIGKLIRIRTVDLKTFANKLEINSSDDPDLTV